ncbi:MAG: hypothetical protein ABR549_13800 [Mycobacteriales bacterium]
MNRNSPDEGAIVLGWLTKVALTLAVLGFLSYDGIAIVTANVSTADRANTLASEAADEVRSMRDVNKAYAAISAEAAADGDTIEPQDFRVASDGHVTLVLRREASSLWMSHVGPLRKFLHVRATGEGSPAS